MSFTPFQTFDKCKSDERYPLAIGVYTDATDWPKDETERGNMLSERLRQACGLPPYLILAMSPIKTLGIMHSDGSAPFKNEEEEKVLLEYHAEDMKAQMSGGTIPEDLVEKVKAIEESRLDDPGYTRQCHILVQCTRICPTLETLLDTNVPAKDLYFDVNGEVTTIDWFRAANYWFAHFDHKVRIIPFPVRRDDDKMAFHGLRVDLREFSQYETFMQHCITVKHASDAEAWMLAAKFTIQLIKKRGLKYDPEHFDDYVIKVRIRKDSWIAGVLVQNSTTDELRGFRTRCGLYS